MEILTTIRLETVLDIALIFLCSLMIIYLIYNKIKYKQFLLKQNSVIENKGTSQDFCMLTIRKQVEHGFDNIIQRINIERQNLQNLHAGHRSIQTGNIENLKTFDSAPEPFQFGQNAEFSVEEKPQDNYRNIENLAGKGMSIKDIARQLNISPGEVELFMKLREMAT